MVSYLGSDVKNVVSEAELVEAAWNALVPLQPR